MSSVTTETKSPAQFDAEAFSLNLARAMENGGRALAAFLKPRQNIDPNDRPPSEIAEVIKTLGTVAEYWLSDQTRSTELQMKLGRADLE